MSIENICNFIPSHIVEQDLITINFVLERANNDFGEVVLHTYTCALVVRGSGMLHTKQGSFALKEGDIFFIFPEQRHRLEKQDNFQYIYISYMGIRANALKERLQLRESAPVYGGYNRLIGLWRQAVELCDASNTDLMTEGLLVYTLSFLCRNFSESKQEEANIDIILRIKNYLEEHFSEPELTLQSVADRYLYTPQYLSQKFRRTVRVGFNEYLTSLRLRQAKQLIAEGVSSVTELSKCCGYSDPLYFSRVFRRLTGLPPRQYISQQKTATPQSS